MLSGRPAQRSALGKSTEAGYVRSGKLFALLVFSFKITYIPLFTKDDAILKSLLSKDSQALRCKQNLRNETEQSGPKSEYLLK